jgi:DNA-binding MarR family transcriptional regulator
MEKDIIKSAFSRVKDDISSLYYEISELKHEISEIKRLLENSTDRQTIQQIIPTHKDNPTDTSTVPQEIEGLKTLNLGISTGNEGVSTDRQTIQQTDDLGQNNLFNNDFNKAKEISGSSIEADIQEASDILDSLDRLKKEIRIKFKRVTPQEMVVFSTIYQIEEENPMLSNYKNIASRLNLSQSSIRDYVQRMINKGIPIKKYRIDNKKVILSISPDLKRIATLSTIIKLREL